MLRVPALNVMQTNHQHRSRPSLRAEEGHCPDWPPPPRNVLQEVGYAWEAPLPLSFRVRSGGCFASLRGVHCIVVPHILVRSGIVVFNVDLTSSRIYT